MRIDRFLAAALVLVAAGAQAADKRYEPKALARYDLSYVRCEARFPEMKGHRDEAYVNLWHSRPGPKVDARLASVRGSAAYKAEREVALREGKQAADEAATKKLEQQCRGLWGEMQRSAPATKPAR